MENYQFIKQIGHGNYGEIWLVKCSKTRKKHVLKRIDLHQAPKREQRAVYLEAKFMSTMKHPNIVTYLDCFHNSAGSIFIVMSYCECGDLYSYIQSRNGVYLEEKIIVQWFVQICLALKYLHDKNILHRNLKTRNIFLMKNLTIKVGDLGISKILSTAQEVSAVLIETPYYTSPETIVGCPLSQKSDIWALGCCMYELTALKHPFIAQDSHLLLSKMKKKLHPIPDVYSPELFGIIASMLHLDPEMRPCATELLLDDYIRRFIMIILQDNTKSPDHLNSGSVSGLSSARSKSSFDLSPCISNTNGVLERSRSTNLLPNGLVKKTKPAKTCELKIPTISVPDVNGNGDGNDNSQLRLKNSGKTMILSHRTDHLSEVDSLGNSSKSSANSDSQSMRNNRQKVSNCDRSFNLTNFDQRTIARQQKKKGEISLQILNNLAYSLYSVRGEKFLDSISNISFEGKSVISPQSKSPTSSSEKKSNGYENLSDSDNSSVLIHQRNEFHLPHIK